MTLEKVAQHLENTFPKNSPKNRACEIFTSGRSAEEMTLKVGDTVAAVIKSTEVMLQKA